MKNRALTVPFVLWAMIFIVVPLVMIVWYGVTVEEPIPYTEIVMEDGSVIYGNPVTRSIYEVAERGLQNPDAGEEEVAAFEKIISDYDALSQ